MMNRPFRAACLGGCRYPGLRPRCIPQVWANIWARPSFGWCHGWPQSVFFLPSRERKRATLSTRHFWTRNTRFTAPARKSDTEPRAQATDPRTKTLLDRQHQVHRPGVKVRYRAASGSERPSQQDTSGPGTPGSQPRRESPIPSRERKRATLSTRRFWTGNTRFSAPARKSETEPRAEASDPLNKTLLDPEHQVHGLRGRGNRHQCV